MDSGIKVDYRLRLELQAYNPNTAQDRALVADSCNEVNPTSKAEKNFTKSGGFFLPFSSIGVDKVWTNGEKETDNT